MTGEILYLIGHIVFVVLSKKNQVYPMQVTEIITKRTLQGEETSYILQAGADRDSKISMDQIDGEVFESPERARQTLMNRASQQINRLIDMAIAKSAEWYGSPVEEKDEIDDVKVIDDLIETVMLPDGTIAKVKLPNF
jgi:hypothetical protein